jgi:hypothetical protein
MNINLIHAQTKYPRFDILNYISKSETKYPRFDIPNHMSKSAIFVVDLSEAKLVDEDRKQLMDVKEDIIEVRIYR